MATIEIPDAMVPAGYELGHVAVNECSWSREFGRFHATVVMRRKPRLKQIVFTVAGEPRQILGGGWFIGPSGFIMRASVDTPSEHIPLTREEVYE